MRSPPSFVNQYEKRFYNSLNSAVQSFRLSTVERFFLSPFEHTTTNRFIITTHQDPSPHTHAALSPKRHRPHTQHLATFGTQVMTQHSVSHMEIERDDGSCSARRKSWEMCLGNRMRMHGGHVILWTPYPTSLHHHICSGHVKTKRA